MDGLRKDDEVFVSTRPLQSVGLSVGNLACITMAKIKKTVVFKTLLRAYFLEQLEILLGGNRMTNF